MKEIFVLSPHRFLRWLWCLVRLQGPFYLMMAGIILLFVCLISYGILRCDIPPKGLFLIFLFCGGVACFIHISREVNNKNTNILWFMLPVSVLERYLAIFLMATVLVPLTMIIGFLFWAQIQEPGSFMFEKIDWNILLKYLCLQPFFLFTAIYFKNKGLLKTFALLCIVLVFSADWIAAFYFNHVNHEILDADRKKWRWVLENIVWHWLAPIFFSILGFLCLKEKEIHNDASN